MESPNAVRVFISYSHRDKQYRDELLRHLAPLRLMGLISDLHDGKLTAGADWSTELREYLESSPVILLLVSNDYLSSQFAMAEMQRAMERGREGTARVVAIIARPCAWQKSPFAQFNVLPAGGKPVSTFKDRDKIWVVIVEAIREVVERSVVNAMLLRTKGDAEPQAAPPPRVPQSAAVQGRRVSDYRFSSEVMKILRDAATRQPSIALTTEGILAAAVAHGSSSERTSAFLAQAIPPSEMRKRYGGSYSLSQNDEQGALLETYFTPNATRLMDMALTTAVATTGNDTISVRHLVFALLQPMDTSIKDKDFAFFHVDLASAAAGYITYLRTNLSLKHELESWENLLQSAVRKRVAAAFAPSYTADQIGGKAASDLLNFENDARALASLIASTNTKPPLSIGLFGDWGSGKSFFMRQIRGSVAQIADSARHSRNATIYHRNIVQIEFNAWHYIEGNLWASLIEHIFSNLRLRPDEDAEDAEAERKRLDLLRLLEVEKQQQEQAKQRSKDAKMSADKAREERTQKIEERVRKELAKTSYLTAALDRETVISMGISEQTLESIGKLRDQGRVYWAIIGRARAALRLLWERSRGFTLLISFSPLAIAGLAYLVAENLDLESVDRIVGIVTAAGTVVASRVAPWMAGLNRIANTVEEKHRELELRRQKEAVAIDEEIAALSRRVETADAEASQASQRITAIESEIQQTTSARIFENFIEERASSTDYRRHLGVLANIRRDFERMARLIEKRQKDPTQPAIADRIVLYIDDLDRCPAKRVVKVLQAIHLLLAFPLFVVVVGVDARWIARSLQLEYDELLGAVDDGLDDSLGIEATPHDYLEKIFQVPFWIRAMSTKDCEHLIEGLTRPEVTPVTPTIATSPAPTSGGKIEVVAETLAADEAAPKKTEPKVEQQSMKAHVEAGNEEAARDRDLNPFALHVLQQEIDLMKRLTPLLGRSPRAVKRFINCYRLIKIGLDQTSIGAFLTDPKSILHYKPVMFLLAMITGVPEFGESVLDVLSEEDETAVEAVTVDGLLQLLAAAMGDRFVDQRLIVANALIAEAALDEHAFRPSALRKAALVVRRYSFRAGYATAARRERTQVEKRAPRQPEIDAMDALVENELRT